MSITKFPPHSPEDVSWLIGYADRAKDVGDCWLANILFSEIILNAEPGAFTLEYEREPMDEDTYHDLLVVVDEDGDRLCIPVPILKQEAVIHLLSRMPVKFVPRLDHQPRTPSEDDPDPVGDFLRNDDQMTLSRWAGFAGQCGEFTGSILRSDHEEMCQRCAEDLLA